MTRDNGARLSVFFVIQGEGRGHMTQAIALKRMLDRDGHRVVACLLNLPDNKQAPDFFERSIGAPVHRISCPPLVLDSVKRGIDWKSTILKGGKLAPTWARNVASYSKLVKKYRPDVVINFYDPVPPLSSIYTRLEVPVVAIAHQFMFLHSRYPRPVGNTLEQQTLNWYTDFIGRGATVRLALSLYDAPDVRDKNVKVVPPLLREDLMQVTDEIRDDGFYLAYLSRPDSLTDLINWHRQHPSVRVHAYRHDPSQPETVHADETLILHQLDDSGFISKMAKCSGLATTAGFETTSEAMFLGKPLLMVPMHLEQKCNALDAALMDAAIIGNRFWLGRLNHFSRRYGYSPDDFRRWIARGEDIFLSEIKKAAGCRRPVSSLATTA